jgi:hypothetical protein
MEPLQKLDASEQLYPKEEHRMRVEIEFYPGDWIEMDPGDLYDDLQMSLTDCLASGRVKPDELDGTYWWTFDLTQSQKEVRVIPEAGDS